MSTPVETPRLKKNKKKQERNAYQLFQKWARVDKGGFVWWKWPIKAHLAAEGGNKCELIEVGVLWRDGGCVWNRSSTVRWLCESVWHPKRPVAGDVVMPKMCVSVCVLVYVSTSDLCIGCAVPTWFRLIPYQWRVWWTALTQQHSPTLAALALGCVHVLFGPFHAFLKTPSCLLINYVIIQYTYNLLCTRPQTNKGGS